MPGHSIRDFDLLPTDSIKRHLAAIVAADVVGYSRLMGVNEKGTLLGLRRHRAELIDALIAAYKGTIVKTTGDGLLLTFPSIVEAVSCAVAWQHGMAKRNQDISLDRRIEFRIGVNIGGVIVEKGDVFGDGVNIAARLEQIAPAGGICLSEDAYRQVRGKIEIPIADAGEQSLKNIANPIRVYRIEASIAATFDAPPPPAESPRWSAKAIAAVAISAAIGLGAILWLTLPRDRTPVVQNTAPSKPVAASAMPVIAVLPFANQTGDSSQEYFADGVTEEVINALGRFNTVRVIGRNAVLRYKKQPPTQDEVTSELGASYLVGGSVRRSGQQVRITAQLTQARDGTVMWSDRYDGEMTDIFDFQDTIAHRIAGTLAANITHVEARRQLDQPPRPNAARSTSCCAPGRSAIRVHAWPIANSGSWSPGRSRWTRIMLPLGRCNPTHFVRWPSSAGPNFPTAIFRAPLRMRKRRSRSPPASPTDIARSAASDGARRIRAIEGRAQTSGRNQSERCERARGMGIGPGVCRRDRRSDRIAPAGAKARSHTGADLPVRSGDGLLSRGPVR